MHNATILNTMRWEGMVELGKQLKFINMCFICLPNSNETLEKGILNQTSTFRENADVGPLSSCCYYSVLQFLYCILS